jgi:hypothetical protein
MRRFVIAMIGLVGTASVVVAVVLASRQTTGQILPLSSFSEAGVQVNLVLDQQSCTLNAQYTPEREKFHVYSKDLPPNGVNGLGRPTRLDVISGLQSRGELTANATTSDIKTEGLDEILPVYPDGPVTLSLPVKVTDRNRAQVKVSYMACSLTGCLPPASKILDLPPLSCEDDAG